MNELTTKDKLKRWFIIGPTQMMKSLYMKTIDRFLHRREYNRLKRYKGIHGKGHDKKRLFIIATGPSLTMDDINLLKNECTFSINSIYKVFDKTDWRPTYYAIFDTNVYRKLHDDLMDQELPCAFCPSVGFDWNKPFVNHVPVKRDWKQFYIKYGDIISHGFSDDITKGVDAGTNVVYVILQIAAYMGFSEIYLLGTDCTMCINHSSLVEYNKDSEEKQKMVNVPNEHIIADYAIVKAEAEKRGIKIFNATRGGALELFPRVNLEDVV